MSKPVSAEPVAWLVPVLNDKPRLFTSRQEAREFAGRSSFTYPQPLVVADGFDYGKHTHPPVQPAPADVEAMASALEWLGQNDCVVHKRKHGQLPEAAAMLRQQAAEIEACIASNTAYAKEKEQLRAENAELRKDAERWRFFAAKDDDFMDESFKLIMLAAGTDNYDAIIDSNMEGNTDAIDKAIERTSEFPIPSTPASPSRPDTK